MFRVSLLLAGFWVMAGAAAGQGLATTATRPVPGLLGGRTSYSFSAGAVLAGRMGSATYLSPTVAYRITPRFSVFGGFTYLRTLPGGAYAPTDGGARSVGPAGSNRYVVQGGGVYAVSPRLSLTGSAWKDLTPSLDHPTLLSPYAGFGTPGSGVNLRADYHISEHLSVSGGVRVSSGATPGYGLGQPFGY